MKPQELTKSLKNGSPGPVYFFSGIEIFIKKKAINDIVKVIPEGKRDFNLDTFYGGETDLAEVLSAARTVPFLSPRRVVIMRDVQKVKLTAGRAELLRAYLSNPVPETVLVLTTEDTLAARSWSGKFRKLWTEVEFRALRGAALLSALKEAARNRGIRMTGEAADVMIEVVGSDLGRLHQEMEKLALSVGQGGEVDVALVYLMVCGYSHQTMFDFVQAVCKRDVGAGLTLLSKVFESGAEAPGLIGMLAKRFRILWHLAEGEGGGAGSVPSVFRTQQWQLRDLRLQAANFSKDEIEHILAHLLRIDGTVKSTSVPPRLLVERFVLSMAARPFPPP